MCMEEMKKSQVYAVPDGYRDAAVEISADGKGFIIELWKKGLLWDNILGVLWIPFATVEYAADEGPGSWWRLHSEVIKNGSEIQGTKTPTSHEILLDIYFALPFDLLCPKTIILDCIKSSTLKDNFKNFSEGQTTVQKPVLMGQVQGQTGNSWSSGSGPVMQPGQGTVVSTRGNTDQSNEGNFAKARWARAIQKLTEGDEQEESWSLTEDNGQTSQIVRQRLQ
ncbi:phorbol ester/diacylglycerol-binding protein unc-13 [Turdus rufiventris]|nr:phorbol ester/diacylglycerol-binding protein unc-13 [Turdus rufiventris]